MQVLGLQPKKKLKNLDKSKTHLTALLAQSQKVVIVKLCDFYITARPRGPFKSCVTLAKEFDSIYTNY